MDTVTALELVRWWGVELERVMGWALDGWSGVGMEKGWALEMEREWWEWELGERLGEGREQGWLGWGREQGLWVGGWVHAWVLEWVHGWECVLGWVWEHARELE